MATKYRSLVRLRRLLLVLMLVLVAGLVSLYLFGRAGKPKAVRASGPSQSGEVPDNDLAVSGEGFDYQLDEGGRTLFAIRGESYRVDRNDNVFLDDIAITAYSPEGDPYHVESTEAVFDPSTEETLLQGEVAVRGPQGLEVTTSRLELKQKGQSILGREPLRFRLREDAVGEAERMRVDLENHLFVLAGKVRFENTPQGTTPYRVEANRLFFDRPRHHLRADGAVAVDFEDHSLRAKRVNIWLQEDEKNLQFVRALNNARGSVAVSGELDGSGGGAGSAQRGTVRYRGRSLSAVFEPGTSELRRFELEGWPWRRAFLLSLGQKDAPPRRLAAGYIAGTFARGGLAQAEAFGGVEVAELIKPPSVEDLEGKRTAVALGLGGAQSENTESGDDAGGGVDGEGEIGDEDEPQDVEVDDSANILRRVTADRAEAGFGSGGGLTEVRFFDNVVFVDGAINARSSNARFDFVIGTGELTGNPVLLHAPQGELTAPRVLYTQASGLIYAEGGTRSQLEESSASNTLGGSPLAKGDGPVLVEAEKAFLRNEPSSFLYQGNVRAWRGENLILANELQGEEEAGRLVAQGKVRTRWYPEPRQGAEDTAASREPIEVAADAMVYSQAAGALTYRGSVRAVQGGRIVACDEMTVELGENDRAEALQCEGSARVEDRISGRVVTGDWARYEMGGRTVEVKGDRVVLRDADGAEVTGRHLTYEFETGVVQVQGKPAAGAVPGAVKENG